MFESLTSRISAAFATLRGHGELSAAQLEEGLRAVRQALLDADVNFGVARDFTEGVRQRMTGEQRMQGVDASQQFIHACHQELVQAMGPKGARLEFEKRRPTVILMAGLQGAGKTTTCAKLAKRLREREELRTLLVAADVKRPAAVEQLTVLGQSISVPVFHLPGATAAEVCTAGVEAAVNGGQDVVLLDTAGRLHVDDEMMAEIAEIAARTKPHHCLLVVDAMTGQDAVRSAAAFHQRLALSGVILTKLDGDARGGAALSLKAVTGCPILFVGTGERLEDLDVFEPERMAGRILGMGDVVALVETAQNAISANEAQAAYEKMVLGSFTLEDMFAQLRMVRRLGPMKKVLSLLPGMGELGGALDVDDRRMVHLEALFTSMTPFERLHPDVLDMSRRRRIARGAGRDVPAVNELLKSYKGMKQLMKQMNKLGLGARLGARAKEETLKDLSPTGELAEPAGASGGLLSGLSGLFSGAGSLRGGGDGAGLPGGLSGLTRGPRPMGSSATRQSGSKRKRKQKQKKGRRRR